MAIRAADWKFLDNVLTSLATKAADAVKISLPGDPAFPITPEAGKAYLAEVQQRFAQLEKKALDLIANNPASSAGYDMGEEIGRTLVTGAKRASKIARELGSELAENFDKTADRLQEGGLTIARSFGFGAALVVIGLLIFFGRKAGA